MKPYERANVAWKLAHPDVKRLPEPLYEATDDQDECERAVQLYLRVLSTSPKVLRLLVSGFNSYYPLDEDY